MSYIELKHLLADLALEAVRDPSRASWVAVAAVCAEHASGGSGDLPRRDCLARAARLASPYAPRPGPQDIARLVRAGLLSSEGNLIRLSPRFDPHRAYVRQETCRLLDAIAILQDASGTEGVEQTVRIAAALFNAGLFFECHEWGEALWKKETGAARELYHGLVQVAAAFYHYEKGNLHGSRTLLAKGQRRLAAYSGTYLSIDLDRFQAALAPWTGHFAGGPRPAGFPRLAIAPKSKGAPRG